MRKINTDTKMTLTQTIFHITDKMMYSRENNYIVETDFGRYVIRRQNIATDIYTHDYSKWDCVYPEKNIMHYLRDNTIEGMISIHRSNRLNIQLLIVARAVCEAYLRYVGYTAYVNTEVVDTMAAMWIKNVSGKMSWYEGGASDLAEAFIAGSVINSPFPSPVNMRGMLENFVRNYFNRKFSSIEEIANKIDSTLNDLGGKLVNGDEKIGWPIVNPFYRAVLAMVCFERPGSYNSVINGIRRVRKNPDLNNNTAILRDIFNPNPPKDEEKKKEDKKKDK